MRVRVGVRVRVRVRGRGRVRVRVRVTIWSSDLPSPKQVAMSAAKYSAESFPCGAAGGSRHTASRMPG